jgi:hypothetical protein
MGAEEIMEGSFERMAQRAWAKIIFSHTASVKCRIELDLGTVFVKVQDHTKLVAWIHEISS